MSAYIVVDTKINNESEYEEYKKLARPIAEKYGGVYRARGGKLDIRETDLWTPVRIVIIEFPDLKKRPGISGLGGICSRKTEAPQECRFHAIYS